MPALATTDDYAMLIGPVPAEDEDRLVFMLDVSSAVVVSVAPGLNVWYAPPLDSDGQPVDPGPVPPNAVLVTCQVASRLMADPDGGSGHVTMERIGLAQTHYDSDWTLASGLLPAGWQLLLKSWRPLPLESVLLRVPHPAESWLETWDSWSGSGLWVGYTSPEDA